MDVRKKILILSANPKATPKIRFEEEVREITEGLRRSKYRDRFDIHSVLAIRLRDIRRALLDYEPEIVHFIGHGEKNGLIVEDELGFANLVSVKALTDLFELCASFVECVILSACYSASQVNDIRKHIDYVIGMRKEISDKAAIEFAVGFYDALGAGKTCEEAFEFGRNAIQMYKLPEHEVPILKKRDIGDKRISKRNTRSDASSIRLAIRSFKHYSEDLDNKVDRMLCLCDLFMGRHLVKGTWDDVKQKIKDFLSQTIKSETRYDLYLPLHSSLTFFVGRMLGLKCGAEINIFQSSQLLELWRLPQNIEMKNSTHGSLKSFNMEIPMMSWQLHYPLAIISYRMLKLIL